jgi:hypothetical protein
LFPHGWYHGRYLPFSVRAVRFGDAIGDAFGDVRFVTNVTNQHYRCYVQFAFYSRLLIAYVFL